MRKFAGFLFAVVLIAIGMSFVNAPLPKSKTKPKPGIFIDANKYPEITYSADTECVDTTGVLPPLTTVDSDFDGDGLPDRVRLAQKAPTHQVLVAWLSSKGNKPIELDQVEAPGNMSISLVKAGQVIQREIKLQHDGFRYVVCGSAVSVYYWNSAKSSLDRVRQSD